jgi:polyhydroxyalkanoate synthesis regulator phasin
MLLGKWISACRKLKVEPCLSSCTNINSKWIKDLNIRPETLRLVQKRALELTGIDNDFLNRTQMPQQVRESIDKWDYMKLKRFCTTKEIVTILKRQVTKREKIFTSYTSDKGLITRIYRKLKKLNLINESVKKMTNELNRDFSKEEVQIAKKHMKKLFTSLAI